MGKPHRIAPDVKEQIIKRIRDDGIPVVQAAQEHGISANTIYAWLSAKLSDQPTISDVRKLKKENRLLTELVGELTIKLSNAQKKSWR